MTINFNIIPSTCHIEWKTFPADIYLFQFNYRNTRKRCEICSKLSIETQERRQWSRSCVFIVNFQYIESFFWLLSREKQKKKFHQIYFVNLKFWCIFGHYNSIIITSLNPWEIFVIEVWWSFFGLLLKPGPRRWTRSQKNLDSEKPRP